MLAAIEFAAVISFAIYGILRAVRTGFDVVGVIAIAFVVTFGGGTLRDLFLDRRPLFWIDKEYYALTVFALAIIGAAFPRQVVRVERFLPLPDALGLGLFSIAGATAAVQSGTSMFLASILGVVTGTFGGVIGDVICNETPSIFRFSELYATCSFVGCWVYLLLGWAGVADPIAVTAGIVVTVGLRLAALRWKIRIPTCPVTP